MNNIVALRTSLKSCPVCGRAPYCEEVAPWPRGHGPTPWAAGCYRMIPFEHFVGVNGDTEADAVRQWNAEADKITRGDFESEPTEFPSRPGQGSP